MSQAKATTNDASSAATDVTALVQDLDGGQFERMLSVALSQAAAAAVDNEKQAEVNVKLVIKPIRGTQQVHMQHTLVYRRPTATGKASEEATQTTTLHVGRYGRLSLTPENQMAFLDRAGNCLAEGIAQAKATAKGGA